MVSFQHFTDLSAAQDQVPIVKDNGLPRGNCPLSLFKKDLHASVRQRSCSGRFFYLMIACTGNLPMYLHSRNCCEDFYNIIKENRNKFNKGVVHSFTGNEDELNKYISLNLFIGINGCSLKTKDNIEVVKKIPLDKLLIETDCPYCEIKSSSASFKLIDTVFKGKVKKDKMKKGLICKDRNEPCSIIQVLEVISKIKNVDKKELSDICYKNSLDCFCLIE